MPQQTKKEIFKILNGFFDRIYVISLERSETRREIIRDSLPGLEYQYYWGVDGREHSMDDFINEGLYNSQMAQIIKVLNNQPKQDMLKNAIACALSHLGVYRNMLENNMERVLVLEDDIILGDDASSTALKRGISELPDNWDLLYLGHLNNNLKPGLSSLVRQKITYPLLNYIGYKRYNPVYHANRYPQEYSGALCQAGYHYGAHAYALSASGAKKLLRYQTPVTKEIDIAIGELCMLRFLNAFSLNDHIFIQNRKVLPSLIEEGEFKQSRRQ